MPDEPWVMTCGAVDHNGYQRHRGALINWRRKVKGYRKVLARRRFDDTPMILKRSRMGNSELNRRVIPTDYRIGYSWPEGYFTFSKYRKRPMVLGRGDGSWDGGPVGVKHRV